MRDVCNYQVGTCRRYEGDQMLGPFFNQCIGSGVQAAEMSSMENAPRRAIRCLGKYSQPLRLLLMWGALLSKRMCCSWWTAVWEKLRCVL